VRRGPLLATRSQEEFDDVGQALKAGTLVQLGASAYGGSGYHSNVVFMNPGTTAANVTTNLRKGDGTLVAAFTLDPLPANGFKQIGTLSAWLPNPNTITDTNLWLEFTSDQPVLSFASVINNTSGDPFAIVMTPEPVAPVAAPVASYAVSGIPTTGQAVTFTDTSTNAPTSQFWAFGDGTTATSGATVQHTFAAAATYRTYTPNNVDLKVGQPYVITWSTPASEGRTHGLGGLAVLGIAQADNITSNHPYVVNFTPTAGMVGVWTYACTVTQCAPTQSVHDGMTGTLTISP